MLVRNVKAGQSCQIRVKSKGKGYCWTLIRILKLTPSAGVIYEFKGQRYIVMGGETQYHMWNVEDWNYRIGVCSTGRTHGASYCVGIDAIKNVGIQWDGFEGSLRTGKVV